METVVEPFNLGGLEFAFYMVGSEVLKIVEIDDTQAFFGGVGLGSGAAPSAGYDVTALTGTFVFNQNALKWARSSRSRRPVHG